MSSPIAPAVLDTVLNHLSHHFLVGAGNDLPTARHAASRMIAAHDPATEEELHLAADIVGFGFHTLEALSEAAAPDLSFNDKLRLRTCAVTLSREFHKAQRKLDQIKQSRQTAAQPTTAPQPEPTAMPSLDPAIGLIEFAREALQANPKHGRKDFSISRQQRRAAERIAENFKRNAAEHARREALKATAPQAETADQMAALSS